MTIQELKKEIENESLSDDILILCNSDNDFISNQYISAISKFKNLKITYVENIDSLISDRVSIFGDTESNLLKVYKTDKLDFTEYGLNRNTNLIISTNDISDSTRTLYSDFIVDIPKLEKWQIKEYVSMKLRGVPENIIDYIVDICPNIYRLDNEICKTDGFEDKMVPVIFRNMIDDGCFSDLHAFNIFSLSNAIQNNDRKTIASVLRKLNNKEIDPMGFYSVLTSTFLKLIKVWMQNNPTPETTGLTAKQIWAINNLSRSYKKESLLSIYEFLTSIDRMIKTGDISTDILVDYIITKILFRGI